MTFSQILNSFVHDTQVHAVAVLIAADIVFGVVAALKLGTFRWKLIADYLMEDVVGKVVPWLALFAFGKVSTSSVAGIDFGTIADAAFVTATLALVGSLTQSLQDLGVNVPAKSGLGR